MEPCAEGKGDFECPWAFQVFLLEMSLEEKKKEEEEAEVLVVFPPQWTSAVVVNAHRVPGHL